MLVKQICNWVKTQTSKTSPISESFCLLLFNTRLFYSVTKQMRKYLPLIPTAIEGTFDGSIPNFENLNPLSSYSLILDSFNLM